MLALVPKPYLEPSVLQRLFRRKIRGNAFVALWNTLAESSIDQVPPNLVLDVLSEYRINPASAQEELRQIYAEILSHCGQDDAISEEEGHHLHLLRGILGLSDGDIRAIERQLLSPNYLRALRGAVADGNLSEAEKARLTELAKSLRLSDELVAAAHREELTPLVQRVFDETIADRRLAPNEEQQLQALAQNLSVRLQHDTATEQQLAYFRLLWRIDQGELPEIAPAIILQKNEQCHVQVPATHYEYRTVTRAIRYGGPTARIRIMRGVYWSMGQVAVDRVTEDVLKQLGTGTLYVTSKRLIFDGAVKTTNIRLARVINFTIFKDGVQIQKDSGKDQFFSCDGRYVELVGVTLNALLRGDPQ